MAKFKGGTVNRDVEWIVKWDVKVDHMVFYIALNLNDLICMSYLYVCTCSSQIKLLYITKLITNGNFYYGLDGVMSVHCTQSGICLLYLFLYLYKVWIIF